MDEPWRFPRQILDEITWCGGATFRILSYWFRIEWNWDALGTVVCDLLSPFELAPGSRERLPSEIRRYGLVRVERPETDWHWVLAEESPLFGTPTPVDAIEWFLWRLNGDISRGARDFFFIHAGAVMTPSGEGVILPGESGAGKSTLVAGLVRSGFGYLSDEFAAIDPVARGLYAVPRAISMKPGSYSLFNDLQAPSAETAFPMTQWHIACHEVGAYGGEGPHQIRWVVAPRYVEGSSTRLESMTPGETAHVVGLHSLSLEAYRGRALPLLADVARAALGFRLVSGDLDEAIEALKSLTGSEH